MSDSEIVTEEILDAMGISRPAYEEIQSVIGRLPTVDELSTLLAMWHSQGNRQSLLSWLRGQPHSAEHHEYLGNDSEPLSREIREPRVKECIAIARTMFGNSRQQADSSDLLPLHRGDALYMVGDVSEYFVDSDYGRRYLHLVSDPVTMADDGETAQYISLILDSLQSADSIFCHTVIGQGGLFGSLVRLAAPHGLGFDILSCREIRLDAFLFGEKGVRFVAVLDEPREDFFLLKLSEARINCCFLGRVTKGRVLVDDMDFGPIYHYC